MKRSGAILVLLLFVLVGLGAAQTAVKPGEKLADVIGTLQGKGGDLTFPCGSYDVDNTITIAADGVALHGSGYCSQIRVNTNRDVFDVTKAFFVLEGFEIVITSSQDRAGAALVRGNGSQGRLEHLRFSGSGKLANNGRVYYSDNQQGGLWSFFDLRFTGGATWQSFISLTSSTEKTVASTRVMNVIGPPTFTDAAFDFNGAIDTFQIVNLDLAQRAGHVFWLRNTVGSPIAPRWVFCTNCSIETRGTTAVQLDAARDFSYHGYISGSDLGAAIGSAASNIDFSHVIFASLLKGAITIAAGSASVSIKDNFFEDTTNAANNQYNTITVAPGASGFQISGNQWHSTNHNKAHYAIVLSPGPTANYGVTDNLIPNDTYAAGAASMGGTGAGYVVSGNTGMTNKTDVK
jgi:hypothetical protein